MTDNQKYLKEAETHVAEFEATLEAERLREAYMVLSNVVVVQEPNPETRRQLRKNCLATWLHMLQIVDRLVDPHFNPDDVPENLVQPPPTTGGVVYPPGADPALIADPAARAEYEKRIAANNKKIEGYRLQLQLSRLKERIQLAAVAFIRRSYTASADDQKELKTLVDEMIQNPARKEALLTPGT